MTRDLRIPSADGATLFTDRYAPRGLDGRPTILIRSPYGRRGIWGNAFARPLAEQGFQVVIQSCRGTFGSGGDFDPLRNERADGRATLSWLLGQPWYTNELATFGPSYLGFTQWALADDAGPSLKAMALQVTSASMREAVYQGETFWLDTALSWMALVENQERSVLAPGLVPLLLGRRLREASMRLPLGEADQLLVGRRVPYFQDWLAHEAPGDPWWQPVDHREAVSHTTAPAFFLGGFYDVFLPQMLADYGRLRARGASPQLTLGPWTHGSFEGMTTAARESAAFFRHRLLGDEASRRASPVRVFVMGAGAWRDLEAWPPEGYAPERWYLRPGGELSPSAPPSSSPDRYRYDPRDPTPAVGGTSLAPEAGPRDNRKLEARPDVLVFTSVPVAEDLEVIGPVTAELFVESSLEHTDFFVRLCDVSPDGRSVNLCDGIVRLAPGRWPDEGPVVVELWPTAHRFRRGHALRVQVSSGAHPRFARNLGTGEPLATATTLRAADQVVHHDPARPSAIVLPARRLP